MANKTALHTYFSTVQFAAICFFLETTKYQNHHIIQGNAEPRVRQVVILLLHL